MSASSCSTPTFYRLGGGFAEDSLAVPANAASEPVDVFTGEARVGVTLTTQLAEDSILHRTFNAGSPEAYGIDLMAGPSISVPTRHQKGVGYGGDVAIRPKLVFSNYETYAYGSIGLQYFDDRWRPQSTKWGFPVQVGAGVRYVWGGGSWVTVEYRHFHESNGSRIFKHKGPNPGFDAGGVFVGFEREF